MYRLCHDAFAKVESADVAEVHVENYARNAFSVRGVKVLVGGSECLDRESAGTNESRQRPSHGRIVIDDADNAPPRHH